MKLRITVAVPERPVGTSGNDLTGQRWARRFSELGHDATVVAVPATRQDQSVASRPTSLQTPTCS